MRLAAASAIAVCVGVFAGSVLWSPKLSYADTRAWDMFQGAGSWVRANVPKDEVVFHVRWDDFPQLWYRDPDHRYIAGLDPLFMVRKDPAKYWLWQDIGAGRRREGMAALIEEGFGARYVLIRTEPHALRSLIKKDPSFERVYGDAEAEVRRIR